MSYTPVGGTPTTQAFSDSPTAGTSHKPSAVDHLHGEPANPASVGASGIVTLTSGDITTTSTTLVDLTGVTITLTTGAKPVQIGFIGTVQNSVSGNDVFVNVDIDGTLQFGTSGQDQEPESNDWHPFTFTLLTASLSAGSHTFKVQWKVAGATGKFLANSATNLIFWVKEITT